MYLQHFGLSEFPFSTSPDPRYYYPTPKHKEALACLLYTVRQKKGFALVTGEVGTGKTMLCHAALRRFGEAVEAATLSHTSLSAAELLQAVGAEFGAPPGTSSKVEMIAALKRHLLELREAGRTAVLIIDEAQDLRLDVLEEIRLLGNLETATDKLLQVLLVGQPELRRLIGSRQLQPLDQRIAVKFHLGPLSPENVSRYVDHRLRIAGATGPLFDEEAKAGVADASGGVPRLINVVCDQALLQAYVQDRDVVSPETVQRIVAEMEGYYMDTPAGEELEVPGSLAEASRARGGPMGVPLRPASPASPRPATPQFESVEVLCDAIDGGWLELDFGTPDRGRRIARYLVDGAEIVLKLARGSSRDYVALVATAP
ncbi:MAG: AAA family ATPase, partial [Candidatus Brocadiaceae bacterium]